MSSTDLSRDPAPGNTLYMSVAPVREEIVGRRDRRVLPARRRAKEHDKDEQHEQGEVDHEEKEQHLGDVFGGRLEEKEGKPPLATVGELEATRC